MIHLFNRKFSADELPTRFTYPFCYTAHALCREAADIVSKHVLSFEDWLAELDNGKMFGVLIVRTTDNQIGFISAFSGNLMGVNYHPYFVPAVYDMLSEDGFFILEVRVISDINNQIEDIENDEQYAKQKRRLFELAKASESKLKERKLSNIRAKELRYKRKLMNPSVEDVRDMARESQHHKAEYKRFEKVLDADMCDIKSEVECFESKIDELKNKRRAKSAKLQLRLFEQFKMLNANGETKTIVEIFGENKPPAGAGECAAPKLLQYAFANSLTPIAMAEFWWGVSPKGEIRHHGQFYPSCKAKCKPILTFMLQGLDVEQNPLAQPTNLLDKLDIVYEDEWMLVINKPHGALSVEGKNNVDSVDKVLKNHYPSSLVVHRLDMATSGLLLIAKNIDIYKMLQSMFANREVTKRYVAILKGVLKEDSGVVELPICPNPFDRPRQMVNYEHGKASKTKYTVVERGESTTRVEFYPTTGRTHQLRVHSAYKDGLNAPIVGDELYGEASERLCLHAEYLSFTHPVTSERVEVEALADF